VTNLRNLKNCTGISGDLSNTFLTGKKGLRCGRVRRRRRYRTVTECAAQI